jgi:hypothetical protein
MLKNKVGVSLYKPSNPVEKEKRQTVIDAWEEHKRPIQSTIKRFLQLTRPVE